MADLLHPFASTSTNGDNTFLTCITLFEDNAEFGYGMLLAQNTIRNRLKGLVEKLAADAGV